MIIILIPLFLVPLILNTTVSREVRDLTVVSYIS